MNFHSFRSTPIGRCALHRRYTFNNRGRRRGSALILVALGITVLLGASALSVDYGLLVHDKNVMQRACDSAALAGASRLKLTNDVYDTSQASILAIDVAGRNGTPITSSDIVFLNGNRTIQVSANANRSLFFARFLGRTSAAVAARATATVKGIDHLVTGYVKPIGITWETYNAYKGDQAGFHDLVLVRQNKEVFGLDDFVLFDLRDQPSKSGAKMLSQLIGDDQETASIGDYETTLNSSLNSEGKKLTDGLDTLMDRAEETPWFDNGPNLPSSPSNTDSYTPSPAYTSLANGTMSYENPRVLNIIITPSTTSPKNGTFDTEIQGFVPVYLEGYYERPSIDGSDKKKDNELVMRVRFLPPASPIPGQGQTTPDGSLSGLRVVSLIE